MPRKLYLAEFAERAGLAVSTLNAYRVRGDARFPEPDGIDIERGHARPWWSEKTVRTWLSGRPGSGNWGRRHARDARS